MDAIQRMRKKAYDYGNLKSTDQMKVTTSGSPQVIEVQPTNPQVIYVPVYTPTVVYAPPPPAPPPPPAGTAFAAGLFGFMAGVALTAAFTDSCWGYHCGFAWSSHTVIIHNTTWGRTWVNRGVYVHTWGGYNAGFYSRPYAYVNRPIQININNVNVNRNVNYRGPTNVNVNRSTNVNVNRPTNVNVNHPTNVNVNRPTTATANAPHNYGYQAPKPPAGAFSGVQNGARTQAAGQRGKVGRTHAR